MMRIQTRAGELLYQRLTFPDGQRHLELLALDGGGFQEATIDVAITSADALFDVLLVKDVLDLHGYSTSLYVRYLLGARMDRRINERSPCTLAVMARLINAAGFKRVRVLDPHSQATTIMLGAEAVYPTGIVGRVLANYLPSDTVIIVPDAGALTRTEHLLAPIPLAHLFQRVQCRKHRDAASGALSSFGVIDPSLVKGKTCLILDDLCDGGGTFTGLAEVLRGHGATATDLYVTHGIFSKGHPIRGIRRTFTTDSYMARPSTHDLLVFPVEM